MSVPVLNDLLTVVVLALVAWRLVGAARLSLSGPGRARVRFIVRGIRWRHVWPIPLVLAAVVAVMVVLFTFVPYADKGWWSLLGGQGNPAFGQTSRTAGTVFEWLIPTVFVMLLVPALPLFAQREEEIFRVGAEARTRLGRLKKSVLFGLVHAVVGIPVGAALALSVGGVYFTHCYLRAVRRHGRRDDGLLESTRAHTAYNGVIVALLLVVVVTSAIGS